MGEDLDQVVEELGAVLAAPDLPRLLRNEPGRDKKWRAGDLARRIPKEQIEAVADKLGIEAGQLRSYIEVARAFPPERRNVKAAWSVYREAHGLPAPRRFEVLRDGLTLRRMRLELGKGQMDRPRKERESDEDRALFILDELLNPNIKAIVEREIAGAGVNRKVRRAAKTALDEIAHQKKYIEAEMKKREKEGSPDRRFWQASRELVNAEHYIYSIARLYQHHADAMSEEQWPQIVEKLRHVSDSALDVATRIEGTGNQDDDVIDVEDLSDQYELPAASVSSMGADDDDDVVDGEIVGE